MPKRKRNRSGQRSGSSFDTKKLQMELQEEQRRKSKTGRVSKSKWEDKYLNPQANSTSDDNTARPVVQIVPKSEQPRQFGRPNKGAFARS